MTTGVNNAGLTVATPGTQYTYYIHSKEDNQLLAAHKFVDMTAALLNPYKPYYLTWTRKNGDVIQHAFETITQREIFINNAVREHARATRQQRIA